MKKTILITAALVGVLILAGGVTVYAFAQGNTPNGGFPFHHGNGGPNGQPNGTFQGRGGPMGGQMQEAMANALGLTTDELQTRLAAGETPLDIAQSQGISQTDFQAAMEQARADAINQAVADGTLTQEQADNMLNQPGKHPGFDGQSMMHDAMQSALANAFGLTPEELQSMQQQGTSLWDYAAQQGMTVADFQTKMESARSNGLAQAVTDGLITQEQADQMQNGKPGGHPGMGNFSGRGGRGGSPGFAPNSQP